MKFSARDRRPTGPAMALALGLSIALAGCGSKEPPPAAPAAAPPPAPAATTADAAPPIVAPVATQAPVVGSWSPEALEELLAPIALYPDPVLSQVLIASTNPQEVLDAGNWLLSNQSLKGNALDEAALKVGFTPPIRALIQFPETVDMMCMELDWTTELGQAFVADQQGVLDAVQRLRKQAKDVGNLKSSDMLKVETQVQEGKEVVVVSPPSPEVVYVPQYDPQAVYAPAPAAAVAPRDDDDHHHDCDHGPQHGSARDDRPARLRRRHARQRDLRRRRRLGQSQQRVLLPELRPRRHAVLPAVSVPSFVRQRLLPVERLQPPAELPARLQQQQRRRRQQPGRRQRRLLERPQQAQHRLPEAWRLQGKQPDHGGQAESAGIE